MCIFVTNCTTVKTVRNLKFISRAKLTCFEWIFKLWTHDQQEQPCLRMFISFSNQNIAVLCMKRSWNGFRFSWNFLCCMRSIRLKLLQTPKRSFIDHLFFKCKECRRFKGIYYTNKILIDTIQKISDVLYQGLQVRVFAGQIPTLTYVQYIPHGL